MTLLRLNVPLAILIGLAGIGLSLAGCRLTPVPYDPSRPETALVRMPPDQWPEIGDDMDYDGLVEAINKSLIYLSRVPNDRYFRFGPVTYSRDHMSLSLQMIKDFVVSKPTSTQLQQFLSERYDLYRSVGRPPDGNVMFTGYFEPLYPGCLNPSPDCNVPIYGVPEDLVSVDLSLFSSDWAGKRLIGRVEGRQLKPYPTRAQIIGEDAIVKKAPIIAWMQDPIDLYFLQVQGSGRIQTPDGRKISILYAAQNGHTADLVGRHLIREDKIPTEEMSMQRIRQYFKEYPDDIYRMLYKDPSFVFFRIGNTDPLGNLGVEVTPGRSIATDRHIFPPGALAFIKTKKPLLSGNRAIAQWVPLYRFVLNQDTGGAIQGPGRVDIFWGSGAYAETAAGHLQHDGELYFLVLKTVPPS